MNSETPPCPFEWSDRVNHSIFGLGTVIGEPTKGFGATDNGHRTEFKGWKVPVTWDNPDRQPRHVMDYALRVVERPDAKGEGYWASEYLKLMVRTLSSRQDTDHAIEKAFRRPGGKGVAALMTVLQAEQAAMSETIAFLEADERGEHP